MQFLQRKCKFVVFFCNILSVVCMYIYRVPWLKIIKLLKSINIESSLALQTNVPHCWGLVVGFITSFFLCGWDVIQHKTPKLKNQLLAAREHLLNAFIPILRIHHNEAPHLWLHCYSGLHPYHGQVVLVGCYQSDQLNPSFLMRCYSLIPHPSSPIEWWGPQSWYSPEDWYSRVVKSK